VTKEEFAFLCAFLRDQSGLVLTEDKTYLVESRLMSVARRRGLQGLSELIGAVRTKCDPVLNIQVVEAMTTNEPSFFRDVKPFDSLRNTVPKLVVPAVKASGGNKLRIWSAACSSGQEPYSIAMVLKENPALLQGLQVEILGTDLSMDILVKGEIWTVQPVRGAARPARHDADELFRAGRREMADQADNPLDGKVRAGQSAAGYPKVRNVRYRVLP